MEIKVERQNRKTIVLKIINRERAVLKAPFFLSDKKIQQFIDEKRSWIEKTVAKLDRKNDFCKGFDLDNYIYIFGDNIGLVCDIVKSKARGNKKAYYKSKFSMLEAISTEISQRIGLGFAEVCICNSVRIWGSYNTSRKMKLNWKLILLPRRLVEYVIIHELCHSRHMNHSSKFWNLVEKYCPDYKKRKAELSNYSFILNCHFDA